MTQVHQDGRSFKLVRLDMTSDEFPHFLKKGLGNDGRLARTEVLAHELVKARLPEKKCIEFVKAVCLWGADPRIGAKVIKHNTRKAIAKAMSSAYQASMQGKICDSLEAVTALKGLAVSFGSKHLKFLSPDRHVVLDSILSERLGYTRDAKGYSQWLSACHEFLKLVRQSEVPYPGIGLNGWRVADIEMAIFNKIRSE